MRVTLKSGYLSSQKAEGISQSFIQEQLFIKEKDNIAKFPKVV